MPSILSANTLSSGFDVANSCRFDDGSSDHMHKTPGSAGSRIKWTLSVWLKRGALGQMPIFAVPGGDTNNYDEFYFNDSNKIQYSAMVSGTQYALRTKRMFRDPIAWMHLALIYDSNNGTAGDRMQLWVNGVRTAEGDMEDTTFKDAQNYSSSINNDKIHYLGKVTTNTAGIFDGYMAQVVFQNNNADSPVDKFGSFDEDSGIWKPINVSGLTLGTNGFYLDFEDSSNLGNDKSGGTDLTEVNIDATNQSTDTCTNNFCVMNPLDNFYAGNTFSEGNLKIVGKSDQNAYNTSTFGLSVGKWYYEQKITASSSNGENVGITDHTATATDDYLSDGANEYGYYSSNGKVYNNGGNSAYGDTFDDGDIIGVAIDLDNNKLYFSKNGTFQNSGDPTTGSTGTGAVSITAAASTLNGVYFISVSDNGATGTYEMNFGSPPFAISSGNADADGHGNFEFAVPSGYFAICTKNLAEYGG